MKITRKIRKDARESIQIDIHTPHSVLHIQQFVTDKKHIVESSTKQC